MLPDGWLSVEAGYAGQLLVSSPEICDIDPAGILPAWRARAASGEQLARWARRGKTSQVLALRAKIVLACGDGQENKAVAAKLRTTEHNVARWRDRFIARRLDLLGDEKRPGWPPSILPGKVEEVVTATLFDLKPHLIDGFKLPADPLFVEKVVDVVGLYHNPPEKAVVLCVDEKSGILALDRSQPSTSPTAPGLDVHLVCDLADPGGSGRPRRLARALSGPSAAASRLSSPSTTISPWVLASLAVRRREPGALSQGPVEASTWCLADAGRAPPRRRATHHRDVLTRCPRAQ